MSLKPKNIDFNETWSALKETVHGVVTLGKVGRTTWNNGFSDVYYLCVAQPDPFADRLYLTTVKFLNDHVEGLFKQVTSLPEEDDDSYAPGEGLLQRYYDAWNEFSQGVQYLNSLYLYLNQQHIKKQRVSEAEIIYGSLNPICMEKLEVGEMGLLSWECGLVQLLGPRLVRRLLAGMQAARHNQPHRAHVLHQVIQSLVQVQAYRKKDALELYMELAETPILNATGEHCRLMAASLLQECDVSSYMTQVLAGLEQEMNRGKQFLHPSSLSKLRSVYEKHMVSDHLEFLHAECANMVMEERSADLKNVYTLLRTIPGALRPLLDITLNHIKSQGLQALENLNGEGAHNQFVEQMLAIHTKYKELFAQVYNSDQAFLGALDKACSAVINARQNDGPCKSPELLARYCDALLKKSSRGVSEPEAEKKLSSSIVIFKYIDDKDVFQKFYARLMAKRLIHQQSHSMDQEEAMIDSLKKACGYEFTNKLLRMFTDVTLSGDMNTNFMDFLKAENQDIGMGFSIHVLQAGAWPLSAAQGGTSGALPPQLEKPIQLFEKYYHNKFNGRKLTWLHHLCMGELKLGYLRRAYYVTMQTAQMSIMMEYEKAESRTQSELVKATRLPEEALARHLTALMDAKLLVASGDLNEAETVVRLNWEFASKRTKLRVAGGGGPGGGGKAGEQAEAERTAASVDEDRKMYLQAAIVRIMKARKVLRHNDLIQEVLAQARAAFAPNIAMIKKCIESLIDKQYIERTPGVSDEYSYVA